MKNCARPTKIGPNDVRCVVWAIGEFFFRVFHILTNVMYIYTIVMETERYVTTKLGPNDMSGVVWAIGKFLSCFFNY